MKNMFLAALLILSSTLSLNSHAADSKDLRSDKEFVATCPEEFLTYIDKSEGGPGAYCACPDENISYMDKAEGGPGFICLPNHP